MHEYMDLSFLIIVGMYLDASFMLAELGPFKHRQKYVYRGKCEGKGIDITVKFEDFPNPTLASLRYHKECKLFDDTVLTLLVGFV